MAGVSTGLLREDGAVGMNRTTLRWISSALLLVALMLPASVPAAAFAAPGPAVGPAISADHLVTQISLAPRTPNILQDNDSITISFSYTTSEAGGVRIFARPFTGGALTPSYAASGSPLYPVGTGVGSGNFTITTGNVTVDQIRFQMLDANQTTLLFEAFIPVHYQFTSATKNVISHIGLTATPNVLKRNQRVAVSFKYTTTRRPAYASSRAPHRCSLTPSYAASGSPLYPVGTGTGSGWFTITSGAPTVTGVRFQMWNANQTRLLFQAVVPVTYQFRAPTNVVNSITLRPANPNILKFGDRVTLAMGTRQTSPAACASSRAPSRVAR